MKAQVVGENGSLSEIELEAQVFDRPFNSALVHQIVVSYQANARNLVKGGKNRSAVRGGGRKPWRQKGSGRARAGTRSSPLWRGGGMTFASGKPNYAQKINRKMYVGAMRSILSELMRQDRLTVVAEVALDEPKTRAMVAWLAARNLTGKLLLVLDREDRNVELAARNYPYVTLCSETAISPVSLIAHERAVFTRESLVAVQKRLA